MQTTSSNLIKKINTWDILTIEKQKHAGFWLRFLAFIIDFSIVVLPLYPLFKLITGYVIEPIENHIAVKILVLTIIFSFIIIIISFFYQLICELSKLSSTIGYRIVRIQTIDKFGRKPTPGQFFLRTSAKFLTFFGFIPFLLIICAFTKNKQNIQDLALGSFVVKRKFIHEIYKNNIELLILHDVKACSLIMNKEQRADFVLKLEAAKIANVNNTSNNDGQSHTAVLSTTPHIVI
ncbi:RDD family protein [Thorsellia anophelis]|uniref:Uncharacterized membrane protein YckC, RDD family n=1 Tax=Thorsellia anophelis DSM 18579 TaxID=1123402 RepID=A0A1I0DWE9_9GAMM|nr:RDD family protein [Thorsellia anophelis]SET37008.1 Uncharacterized membrane protein YckC, RDD family [Thorsellia anophelis DSM 18579]